MGESSQEVVAGSLMTWRVGGGPLTEINGSVDDSRTSGTGASAVAGGLDSSSGDSSNGGSTSSGESSWSVDSASPAFGGLVALIFSFARLPGYE